MNDPNYEADKERCLKKYINLPSYERNIISNVLHSSTSLGVVILSLCKITSPFVAVGAGVLYSLAYFIHQDKKFDDYKREALISHNELQLKEDEIRRLSIIASSNTNTNSKSSQTSTDVPPIDSFEIEFEK